MIDHDIQRIGSGSWALIQPHFQSVLGTVRGFEGRVLEGTDKSPADHPLECSF